MKEEFDSEKCPICFHLASLKIEDGGEWAAVNCDYCGGKFKISNSALYLRLDRQKYPDWQIRLSYWINKNSGTEPLIIDQYQLPLILQSSKFPELPEQVDILLRFLGKMIGKIPSNEVEFPFDYLIPIIGAYNHAHIRYVLNFLVEEKLINYFEPVSPKGVHLFNGRLTYKGWQKYGELIKPSFSGKTVFMAMDYHNKALEKIFPIYIVKAVRDTGFEIQLLRDVLEAGSIDDQLRVRIRKAKFVIADLTDKNNGAYWEAGFAEGLGKPVIYLCEKEIFDDFKTHFDTNHLTTVTWHPETIIEDMNNLKAIIRNTFPGEAILED